MGLTVFVASIWLAFGIIAIWREFRAYETREYDERQFAARAKGTWVAFVTLVFGNMFLIVMQDLEEWNERVDARFAIFAVVMISMLVFVCYCALKDALFQRDSLSPEGFIVLSVLGAAVNAYLAIRGVMKSGSLLKNGKLTVSPAGNVLIGTCLLIFSVILIGKKIAAGRAREDE